ncbi:hypothetical protein [Methanospirillum lacunae]|uniref:Uncharacterized protein n=1 Tax=Methanospirillum lacunae TaxID=668570 RepID=A0A2V2NDN6_9EURY|nr:hypothetical protein [Methanospirillum lacunae]PWR74467.1 hypothetical protein DK846_04800 [Methanospirillum lacunae]
MVFSGVQVTADEPGLVIVEKNKDTSEILSKTEYSFADINTSMTSIGAPGGILLSFQGPTFDPSNLWDPEASLNIDNLKTKVIGVPVKEILDKANYSGKIINVTFVAEDGFQKTLPSENIINPPKDQGLPILAYWYADQGLLPEDNGYRLYFTAPDGLYGNTDMKNTLPESYQHYFYNSADKILYPSAKGMSVAKIAEIDLQMDK